MGASVSTNVAKVTVNAIAKVASEIIQKTTVSNNSTQIISVVDNAGDVVIDGNTMRQRASVNMQALFDVMATEEVQQKLAVEIAQEAKAITSGLNLGQFSDASNTLDTLIAASIDVSSKIGQTCDLSTSQSQSIIVERVGGDTKITNNVLDQVTDLLQNCIVNAVSNNRAIQDVTAKLQQEASASSEGVSMRALALLLGLLVGGPIVGGVVGGVYVLKYIFPIVLVAGMVMIAVYVYTIKDTMNFTAFSKLIENSEECGAVLIDKVPITTAQDAAAACLANSECVAVDFKAYDVNGAGAYTPLDGSALAKYYSSLACTHVKHDGASLVRAPVLFNGTGAPINVNGAVPGDVYVITPTSVWYQLDSNKVWRLKTTLILDPVITNLTVSGAKPSGLSTENSYWIYANPINMAYWHIYKYVGTRWLEQATLPGPGMYTVVPPVSNVTAFKVKARKQWLLYVGIAAAVLGLGGTVYTMYKSSKEEEKPK